MARPDDADLDDAAHRREREVLRTHGHFEPEQAGAGGIVRGGVVAGATVVVVVVGRGRGPDDDAEVAFGTTRDTGDSADVAVTPEGVAFGGSTGCPNSST
jgi:hypothetical protein